MLTLRFTLVWSVVRLALTLVLNCEYLLDASPLAFPFKFSRKLQRFHGSLLSVPTIALVGAAWVVTLRRCAAGVSSAYGTNPSDITRTMPRRTASSEAATTKVSFRT